MTNQYALIVIGAGPAGMAAATTVSRSGQSVLVLDDQASPGGQIYRNITRPRSRDIESVLGTDYIGGQEHVDLFSQSQAQYSPSSTVWSIDSERRVSYLKNNASHDAIAEHLVIATGSQERPMPFPGWELPGVMTAGAAQILLKSQWMLPTSAPVLLGSGPLLLLLAWQYLNAGIKIQAIVDTTPSKHYLDAIRFLPGALAHPSLLLKGLKLLQAIRRAGVFIYRGAEKIRASGDSQLRQVSFEAKGRKYEIDTDQLLIHQGVIPQLQLAKLAGCELSYLDSQKCWSAKTNRYGESSATNIHVIGDGQQINGAELAAVAGKLCGLQVLKKLEKIDLSEFDHQTKPLLSKQKKLERSRQFVDQLYRPAENFIAPSDDTIVCRCEEVTAGTIRQIARQGCQGPNQAKAFSRCGMGACQGRYCEATVVALIAEVQNRNMADVGFYRVRPPIKPLTLGQLGRAGSAE